MIRFLLVTLANKKQFFTFLIERGILKSLPPWSLKPQGMARSFLFIEITVGIFEIVYQARCLIQSFNRFLEFRVFSLPFLFWAWPLSPRWSLLSVFLFSRAFLKFLLPRRQINCFLNVVSSKRAETDCCGKINREKRLKNENWSFHFISRWKGVKKKKLVGRGWPDQNLGQNNWRWVTIPMRTGG